MNAQQFYESITRTTKAALAGSEISLPEIIGCLEMTKINAERAAFTASQTPAEEPEKIIKTSFLLTPPTPGSRRR